MIRSIVRGRKEDCHKMKHNQNQSQLTSYDGVIAEDLSVVFQFV